jgi:hypothetical protein
VVDSTSFLVAQVFNLCEGFSHSLERLCHQAEILMGKDKPIGGEGQGEIIFAGSARRDLCSSLLTCHSEDAERPKNLITTGKYEILRSAQDDKIALGRALKT